MNSLKVSAVEESELVGQTFDYWFNDHHHIRSPFPDYIRPQLKQQSLDRFFHWLSSLNTGTSKEINDHILSEKFEEIIFETALNLVLTDDERITVNYPFMPRIGDEIEDDSEGQENGRSKVVDRSLIKEGDLLFLYVKLERLELKGEWETRFELPV